MATPKQGQAGVREGSNCWPSAADELLLHAAIDPTPQAAQAWREWATPLRLEQIDIGCQRLLPAVYSNLRGRDKRALVGEPHAQVLAGAYRRTWYRNQLLFATVAPLIGHLCAGGVPVMVIKGGAIATLRYRDVAARPMEDIDLLVAPEQARRAMELLEQAGWRPEMTPAMPGDVVVVRPAWHYLARDGTVIDLHWRLFEYSGTAERDVWDQAVTLELIRTPALALSAEHELLLTCAHGVAWNPVAPLRWAADAAMILRSVGSQFDWDELVSAAERHRVGLALAQLLTYLRREFLPEIPVEVTCRLEAISADRAARVEHRASMNRPSPVRNLPSHWAAFRARRATPVTGEPRLNFTDFMLRRWSLSRRRELPAYFVRKLRLMLRRGHARAGERRRPAANS